MAGASDRRSRGRRAIATALAARGQRNAAQVSQIVHRELRRLDRDRIRNLIVWVQPVYRIGLRAAGQRLQHAVRRALLVETDEARHRPVERDIEGRLLERLLDASVGKACHASHPGQHLSGESVVGLEIGPAIWTSIGAGEPKLRICETMSAGRNENVTPGKSVGQRVSQLAHVPFSRRMVLVQRNEHIRILGADRARIAVSRIDAGDRLADVGDHACELFRRNDLTDCGFDVLSQRGHALDPKAGLRADVKLDLA